MQIRSSVDPYQSQRPLLTRVVLPTIWLMIGALVSFLVMNDQSVPGSLSDPQGLLEESLPSLADQNSANIQAPQRSPSALLFGRQEDEMCSATELAELKAKLEVLQLLNSQYLQEAAVYKELIGIKELSSVIQSHSFVIAELTHSEHFDEGQNTALLCKRDFPRLNVSLNTQRSGASTGGTSTEEMSTRDMVKVGDLVVSQGALLGEISEIQGQCFKMIPVESKQSSFEVRLEQSGIRGVVVGRGEEAEEHKPELDPSSNRGEKASMELKYLERSRSAVIGERALLVRHIDSIDDANKRTMLQQRWPSFTVGDVIEATLDENGLFQSATLASPLSRDAVDFVLIVSRNPH